MLLYVDQMIIATYLFVKHPKYPLTNIEKEPMTPSQKHQSTSYEQMSNQINSVNFQRKKMLYSVHGYLKKKVLQVS